MTARPSGKSSSSPSIPLLSRDEIDRHARRAHWHRLRTQDFWICVAVVVALIVYNLALALK